MPPITVWKLHWAPTSEAASKGVKKKVLILQNSKENTYVGVSLKKSKACKRKGVPGFN